MHTILAVFVERGREAFQIRIVKPMRQPQKVLDYIAGISLCSLCPAQAQPISIASIDRFVVLDDPLRRRRDNESSLLGRQPVAHSQPHFHLGIWLVLCRLGGLLDAQDASGFVRKPLAG
jgi:hypothetical protein